MSKRGLYIQSIGMFLIYLIIILPIYSSNALALYFDVGVHGTDNIDGFRRPSNDMTIINATVTLDDNSEVSGSQVRLVSDFVKNFDCSFDSTTGSNYCELKLSDSLPPGPKLYELKLFSDSEGTSELASDSVGLYVDALAPTIEKLEVSRVNDSIGINYKVTDSAFIGGGGVCSGIETIQFLVNSEKKDELAFDVKTCEESEDDKVIEIFAPSSTVEMPICIRATDRLGNSAEDCESMMMDFQPPSFINATLYHKGKKLTSLSPKPVNGVSLVVYIKEESDLNVSKIHSDFSELNINPQYTGIYSDVGYSVGVGYFGLNCVVEGSTADYSSEDDSDEVESPETSVEEESEDGNVIEPDPNRMFRCEWNNMMINVAEDNPSATFSVEDSLGNVLEFTNEFPLTFDDVKPVLTSIRSEYIDEDAHYWVGPGNNTIYADVDETGSGLSERKVFLDFESFGTQQTVNSGEHTVLMPNNCTEGWICEYMNVQVTKQYNSGDGLSVHLTPIASTDDAGNWFDGLEKAIFSYDKNPPIIINVENSSICPAAPGVVEYVINVTDEDSGGVRVIVNASEISTDIYPIEFECQKTEDSKRWECPITINNLYTTYVKGDVELKVVDLVGNENVTTIEQEVCEALDGVEPDVVSSEATVIPTTLDRIVAGYLPYPAFASIDFSMPMSVSVQDIKMVGCVSDGAEITEPYVLTPFNFEEPIIGFKVMMSGDTVQNLSTLGVTCNLELIIRSGQQVYTMPEHENVSMNFDLEGTVFGGMDQAMADKIAKIDKEIESVKKEADSYESAINVLGTICTIAEFLTEFMIALQVIKLVIYGVAGIAYLIANGVGNKDAADGANKLYYNLCKLIDKGSVYVTTLAWQIDSNPIYLLTSLGGYIKIVCAWFTCRLSETGNYLELITFAGTTGDESGEYTFQWGEDGGQTGEPNGWDEFLGAFGLGYKWDPYKSYPVAYSQSCLPGMRYNLLKQRQNLCIEKRCIQEMVSSGFDIEACEKAYNFHQCLYFDSAGWNALDPSNAAIVMSGLNNWMLKQLVGAVLAGVMRNGLKCGYPVGIPGMKKALDTTEENCGKDPGVPGDSEGNWALMLGTKSLACGTLFALQGWQDIGDWLQWSDLQDWNKYDAALKGSDYCAEE